MCSSLALKTTSSLLRSLPTQALPGHPVTTTTQPRSGQRAPSGTFPGEPPLRGRWPAEAREVCHVPPRGPGAAGSHPSAHPTLHTSHRAPQHAPRPRRGCAPPPGARGAPLGAAQRGCPRGVHADPRGRPGLPELFAEVTASDLKPAARAGSSYARAPAPGLCWPPWSPALAAQTSVCSRDCPESGFLRSLILDLVA